MSFCDARTTAFCVVVLITLVAVPLIKAEHDDVETNSGEVDGSNMTSILKHLLTCFPQKDSFDTCSANHRGQGDSIQTCSYNIAEKISTPKRRAFVKRLAECKFRTLESQCDRKYCSDKLKSCFGDLLQKSIFEDKTKDKLCKTSNGNQLHGCMQSMKKDCYEDDTVTFFQTFVIALCTGSDTDVQYLLDVSGTFPPGIIDLSQQDELECGDIVATISRSKSVSSRGCSQTAVSLGQQLLVRYESKCAPAVSCSKDLAKCFEALISKFEASSAEALDEKLICSSVNDIKTCFGKTDCDEELYKDLVEYMDEACPPV